MHLIFACVRVRARVRFVHVKHTTKITAQNNYFSANKYYDCTIYCLEGLDKSSSQAHIVVRNPHKCSNKYAHFQ